MIANGWAALITSGIFMEVLEYYRDRLPELGFRLVNDVAPTTADEVRTMARDVDVIFGPGPGSTQQRSPARSVCAWSPWSPVVTMP